MTSAVKRPSETRVTVGPSESSGVDFYSKRRGVLTNNTEKQIQNFSNVNLTSTHSLCDFSSGGPTNFSTTACDGSHKEVSSFCVSVFVTFYV